MPKMAKFAMCRRRKDSKTGFAGMIDILIDSPGPGAGSRAAGVAPGTILVVSDLC